MGTVGAGSPAPFPPAVDLPKGSVGGAPLAAANTVAIPIPAANVTTLADSLLATFKAQFGALWNNTFSADHQATLTAVMDDVAYVATAQLAGVNTQSMRAQIDAQLSNIAGVEHTQLSQAVWATLGQVAKTSLNFALQAAVTAL